MPILCYVTDRRSLPGGGSDAGALAQAIRRAAQAGVDWIQIREKDFLGRALYRVTAAALEAVKETGSTSRIVVNDRLDVAIGAEAGGVHLGGASLPVEVVAGSELVRTRANFLVGASCHSLDAVEHAAAGGASYVFFGPVFATPSKAPFGSPQGLPRLAEAAKSVSIPVLAIGGITAANARACLEAGAAGIAAIRLFQDAADPAAVVRELRRSAPE